MICSDLMENRKTLQDLMSQIKAIRCSKRWVGRDLVVWGPVNKEYKVLNMEYSNYLRL